MRRRLGVSETPVTASGPWMVTSWMCGSAVTPNPVPMRVSISVESMGISRSSSGPAKCRGKTTAMRCGPAAIWIGGLSTVIAFWSASLIPACTSTTAARSPLIRISTGSLRSASAIDVLPNSSPDTVRTMTIWNT